MYVPSRHLIRLTQPVLSARALSFLIPFSGVSYGLRRNSLLAGINLGAQLSGRGFGMFSIFLVVKRFYLRSFFSVQIVKPFFFAQKLSNIEQILSNY